MPTVITEGALAARGFGLGASAAGAGNYIEDVFSTWLYTGNGSTQTITNGIDLSTKGGLVWTKNRSNAYSHYLIDSARGSNYLSSNTTTAQASSGSDMVFGTTGYTVGNTTVPLNSSGQTVVGWTFRKQAKFFDVVTYTGTGSARTIAHNLGSVPGCIIIKEYAANAVQWLVYHSGVGPTGSLCLNDTFAADYNIGYFNNTAPTSTNFTLGGSAYGNQNGQSFVAYLFASNAGGFGAAGTDNVISCGSFTVSSGTGSTDVNLGYEPQWLLAKPSTDPGFATDWYLYDTMRGWVNTTDGGNVNRRLNPNLDILETSDKIFQPTATGFTMLNNNVYPGVPITYIYVAIRRGPMKTPTDATKVFSPVIYTSTVSSLNTNIVSDLSIQMQRDNGGQLTEGWTQDRLRGVRGSYHYVLATTSTIQEESGTISGSITNFGLSQYSVGMVSTNQGNSSGGGNTYVDWFFARAPGFFDEVCYTGTSPGSGSYAINHNLGVAPELIIYRQRNGASNWQAGTNFTSTNWRSMLLNFTNAGSQTTYATNDWFAAQPTSTTFTVGWPYYTTGTWVAYLFATCPGVSKVGSYTGTGATQTIDCGFTGGARFVLIKRTDSTGDWYVWDTARGMVSGTDPSLLLNSTAAEVNANSVYTATTGFQIVSTAAGINASGGTYIFLAIA
jgi:hypothetical protein